MKGTYLLILCLEQALHALEVGRLGTFDLAAGFYLYVGSAFGSGGLPARLEYHRKRVKARPHWHIDYLRAHARLYETWSVASTERLEERWAAALAELPGACYPIRGFGSSDAQSVSHLLYLPTRPSANRIGRALLAPELLAQVGALTLDVAQYEDEP